MNSFLKINLKDLEKSVKDYDLFICCASFEERSLAVATNIASVYRGHVLVCHYYGTNHKSDINYSKLKCLFAENSSEVPLKKNSPLDNYDNMYDSIQCARCKSILIDVSTMTRETLLILLVLLRQPPFSKIDVKLCYVPAAKYSDSESNEQQRIWLSRGVHDIRTVLGFSGFISPSKKNLLIVLVGFETERANILINSFEADKLYLGYAPPGMSHSKTIAEINKSNFDKLVKLVGECEPFEFSCKDIQQTFTELEHIIEANKDYYNIIISPMNNKLSTIAVATIAFKYPEVQICYASTNQYNTEAYSSPAQYAYIQKLDEILSWVSRDDYNKVSLK